MDFNVSINFKNSHGGAGADPGPASETGRAAAGDCGGVKREDVVVGSGAVAGVAHASVTLGSIDTRISRINANGRGHF